jgi:hypothetical protein
MDPWELPSQALGCVVPCIPGRPHRTLPKFVSCFLGPRGMGPVLLDLNWLVRNLARDGLY